jgi:hypothetical protein
MDAQPKVAGCAGATTRKSGGPSCGCWATSAIWPGCVSPGSTPEARPTPALTAANPQTPMPIPRTMPSSWTRVRGCAVRACGWNGARDYAAAINIALLGVAYLLQERVHHERPTRAKRLKRPTMKTKPLNSESYIGSGLARQRAANVPICAASLREGRGTSMAGSNRSHYSPRCLKTPCFVSADSSLFA